MTGELEYSCNLGVKLGLSQGMWAFELNKAKWGKEKLYKKFHNLHSSTNIFRVTKKGG
jgi:hypothetical protein